MKESWPATRSASAGAPRESGDDRRAACHLAEELPKSLAA